MAATLGEDVGETVGYRMRGDTRTGPDTRIEVVTEAEGRVVRPTGVVGEAVYPVAVARSGDYRLRLHVAGPSSAEAEIAPVGEAEVLESFLGHPGGGLDLELERFELGRVAVPEGSESARIRGKASSSELTWVGMNFHLLAGA